MLLWKIIHSKEKEREREDWGWKGELSRSGAQCREACMNVQPPFSHSEEEKKGGGGGLRMEKWTEQGRKHVWMYNHHLHKGTLKKSKPFDQKRKSTVQMKWSMNSILRFMRSIRYETTKLTNNRMSASNGNEIFRKILYKSSAKSYPLRWRSCVEPNSNNTYL